MPYDVVVKLTIARKERLVIVVIFPLPRRMPRDLQEFVVVVKVPQELKLAFWVKINTGKTPAVRKTPRVRGSLAIPYRLSNLRNREIKRTIGALRRSKTGDIPRISFFICLVILSPPDLEMKHYLRRIRGDKQHLRKKQSPPRTRGSYRRMISS